MTLPRDVAEAVELGDQFAGTYEHGFAVKNAWGRIRAHLLSQDAEIERLRSRLAAADALLRKFAKAVTNTAFEMPPPNRWTPVFVQMAQEAVHRIDAHLQGNNQ